MSHFSKNSRDASRLLDFNDDPLKLLWTVVNCVAHLLTGLAAAGVPTSVAHLELTQSDAAVEVDILTA